MKSLLEDIQKDIKDRSRTLLLYVLFNIGIILFFIYMIFPVNVVNIKKFETEFNQYENGSIIHYSFTFDKFYDFNIVLNKAMYCDGLQVQVIDKGIVESTVGNNKEVLSSIQMINTLPEGTTCQLDFSFYFEMPFGKRADQTHIQSNEFTII